MPDHSAQCVCRLIRASQVVACWWAVSLCFVASAHAQGTRLSGDISITRMIDALAEKTGITIRYPPEALRGKVTVRSPSPLTDDDLWDFLNDSLRDAGYTTIRRATPGTYEVVLLRDAAGAAFIERESDEVKTQHPQAGFRTVLLTASPIDTAECVALIQPLVSPSVGKVVAIPGSNEVLVSDFASRMPIIVSTLDRVRHAEGEIVIEALRAPAGRAVEFASAIKQLASHQQSAGGKPLRGDVIASADGASVTVVAPFGELSLWTRLAEQAWPTTLESRQYFVPEFDSETLRSILDEAIQAQSGASQEVTVFANTFTGAVTVNARSETHEMLAGLVEELRNLPSGARLGMERFPIRYRAASDLAEQLSELLGSNAGWAIEKENQDAAAGVSEDPVSVQQSTTLSGGPTISIDEATNSILVIGTPVQVASVRELTEQLDTPISQVMLEILLVSLTDTETLDLGIELEKIEVGGGTLFRLSSLFGLGTDAAAAVLPGAGSGLTGVVLDPGEFSVLIRALETVNEGRSVSMPRVLVANAQEAEFNSVVQQPILSTNASDVVATTSFGGFEDAGTTITVSPQILAGEQLSLDYSVTLSTFVGDSSGPALPPPRQQNQLSSTITIPDSYTVAVGGIELDTFGEAESRVPLIGRVPWLGELFKNRSRSRSRTRFYVFIRASIYQDAIFEQLRYVSDTLADEASVPTGWPVIKPQVIR